MCTRGPESTASRNKNLREDTWLTRWAMMNGGSGHSAQTPAGIETTEEHWGMMAGHRCESELFFITRSFLPMNLC